MIYVVSTRIEHFENNNIEELSVNNSLTMLNGWGIIQIDSVVSGNNPHKDELLFFIFGYKKLDIQIIVDCRTISFLLYKEILESKFIVGYNMNLHLQFLYNYSIIPKRIYDVSIAEFILTKQHYNLCEIILKRFNINIEEERKEKKICKKFYEDIVECSLVDLIYLEDIMYNQIEESKNIRVLDKIHEECNFILPMAYINWCSALTKKSNETSVPSITKKVLERMFQWIISNDYFKQVHLRLVTQVNLDCDCPKEITNFPEVFNTIMKETENEYYNKEVDYIEEN